ncbi:MAG: S9 family peptidase [Chloroflexi bacterium]|nr:S9 family peptidase [Chloroflexota bacterium]
MTAPQTAPYGSWRSPITSDLIVAGAVSLSEIALHGDDVYWIEGRPSEGGRQVIVRRTSDGQTHDLTPAPFNARTRVHEYGGGAYVVADGAVFFANFADQQVYRQTPGAAPAPITPEGPFRYADFVADAARNRLICVREDHTNPEPAVVVNTLVALAIAGDNSDVGTVLVSGADFYASPCLSPDGVRLAWLSWNHPNMPWDGCELWSASLQADGSLGAAERVAGGPDESAFQPQWSPDGVLHFVSDRTGWWNLYRRRNGETEALCPRSAEFGRPQWVFGLSTYAFLSATELLCAFTEQGVWWLAFLDTATGAMTLLETPFTEIAGVRASGGRAAFLGASAAEPSSVILMDVASGQWEAARRSVNVTLDAGHLTTPQPVEFPTEGGLTAHALYYPPHNSEYTPPPGERPPLLVMAHGGPTAAASSALNLRIQYWTSRGIAVLDVNYGGSTGFGRPYRQRLNDAWGIVDMADCANGARWLAERGDADPARLAITGGSAGGYTTLCALTFRSDFKAGASYYGICDLEALATDTHKFESRYPDRLVGPYPEGAAVYRERSPIHFTDLLSCPIILFQGLDDKVVPPNQAEMMLAAVRAKGLPVAYVQFAGEGHGFRRAENIKRALDSELYFYARVFGFTLADPPEPVTIENL